MTALRPTGRRWRQALGLVAGVAAAAATTVPLAAPATATGPYGDAALVATSGAPAVDRPVLPPAAGHDVPPLAVPVPGRSAAGALVAAPAAPPVPPTPTGLSTAVDPLSPYIPQRSCDYTAKPGVTAFQGLVQGTYPDTGSYGIVNTCLREGSTSEHAEGRAWDWAVSVTNPAQVAEVNALNSWLLAPDAAGNPATMARRLGIMYIIWDGQIWGTYAASAGWRPYSCSGVTACHQDHVHFSFSWAGAWQKTSYWSRNVAPVDYGPCVPAGQRYAPAYTSFNPTACAAYASPPAPTSDLQLMQQDQNLVAVQGDSGTPVSVIQRQVQVVADGSYGAGTAAAVAGYQRARGLPATGSVGPATWRSFLSVGAPPATVSWAGAPAPAVVAVGPAASLFARTSTGSLVRKDYRDGDWTGWGPMTGAAINAPSATLAPGGVAVAVRGTDSHVWLGTAAGSPWRALGGAATSSPSVAAGPAGTEIFVRGTDNGIWTRTSSATSVWNRLGGVSQSAPAAVVGPDGTAVVVVVGTNRTLYQNRRSGGRWTGWSAVGGIVTADPALTAVPATGTLLAVVRGTDARAYAATGSLSSPSWSGWTSLGGVLGSGPAATSAGAGLSRVVVYGSNGVLYQQLGGPTWSGWLPVP